MESQIIHRVFRGFKCLKIEDEQFEVIATTILRVPGYFILDYSYQNDFRNCIPRSTSWPDIVSSGFAIFAVLQGLLVLLLPLKQLVSLYMHYLTIAVLAASDTFSRYYVHTEKQLMKQWPEYGTVNIQGFSNMLMLQKSLFDADNDIETLFLRQHVAALVFHTIVAMMVTFFLDLESNKDKILLLVYLVPVLGRLAGCSISNLHIADNFASCFVIFITIQYIFLCMPRVFKFVKEVLMEVMLLFHWFSWQEIITKVFNQLFVPVQMLIFWLVLFFTQLCSHIDIVNSVPSIGKESEVAKTILESSILELKTLVSNGSFVFGNKSIEFIGGPKSELIGNRWHLLFIQSAAEVCITPMMLAGACVCLTYFARVVLKLAYSFTVGPRYAQNPDLSTSFYSGFTMGLLALQTSLLNSPLPHRVALFLLILRIVFTNLIQNVFELVEPLILALSTQGIAPISRHLRACFVLIILFLLPLYMVQSLFRIFDDDIWLLIVASANLLTSVQALGLIVTYAQLTWDAASSDPWPELDDIIYYVRASTRVCEFAIALFLVGNGLKEVFLLNWSIFNALILFTHTYFNVWQKLQQGWRSFLMRREASSKISALPLATEDKLKEYNDVCAICYSEMTSACVTYCNHIFHAPCLKKWLYSRDTCPLCQASIHFVEVVPPETCDLTLHDIEDEIGNNIPYFTDEEDNF